VAKVKERLAVNKRRSHRFHVERFNLKKLSEVEGKEKFNVEVSNRFAALGDLDALTSGMRHIKVKILKEEDNIISINEKLVYIPFSFKSSLLLWTFLLASSSKAESSGCKASPYVKLS
jgi:hypothetical protein